MASRAVAKKSGYHHGDLRQQLINAAASLVAERGPEQFTMADAARMAGVSIAAPYRHFQSRDDLLDSVRMGGIERMARQMNETLVDQTPGSLQAIAALGKTYVAFAVSEPAIFRLMFQKIDDEERDCKLEQSGRECYGVLLNEVARLLKKDEIDEQVLQTALPLWTFVHGMAVLIIDDHLRVADFDGNTDDIIESMTMQVLGRQG